MTTSLSYSTCFKFGWNTFKSRPWFFVAITALMFAFDWFTEAVSSLIEFSADLASLPGGEVMAFVVTAALWTISSLGVTALMLSAHDDPKGANFKDLWHPDRFWNFLGMSILTGIIVIVGLILLVVPGLIAISALLFTTYLVAERNLGPIESIKESIRITKGHRLALFGFLMLFLLINILGALALLVGLLVTLPVTMLALVHAYRTLSASLNKTEPTPAPDVIDVTPILA